MILDENIEKTHRERIERHKRIYEDRAYNNYEEDEENSSPFIFQTVICMFIFATLVILKLTNTNFTDKIVITINTSLEKNSLPELMEFAENVNQNFSFNQPNVTNENSYDNIDEAMDEQTNSEIIPATEFTIDENILSDITTDSDSSLIEKK